MISARETSLNERKGIKFERKQEGGYYDPFSKRKSFLGAFLCVFCAFLLVSCAPNQQTEKPLQCPTTTCTPIERIVYQDRVNPQYFIITKNETVYMSFCNTSLNLSSLDVTGLVALSFNQSGYMHNQSLQLLGASDNSILLWVYNRTYIMHVNQSLDFNYTYYTLRELYTMTHPHKDAIAFVEVRKHE